MIDWDLIRKNWNEDYGTKFQNRKEFLGDLYKEYKSCPKIAEMLIVSPFSVNQRLKKDGTKLLDKGHRFPSSKQKIILDIDTSKMTISEIVKATKLSNQYIWFLLQKFKKKYRKKRK